MQNGLAGISGLSGLGSLSGNVKELISQNKNIIDRVLKEEKLNGLGKVNTGEEKLSFMQVVDQYNEGISTAEIKAWIYYKRKQGIPMNGWSSKYNVSDTDLPKLVKAGVMFDHDSEYLPYPIFTYGNMYERKRILIENTDRLIGKYGQKVFDNHLKAIESAMPKKISIKHEDPKERPVILAVSKLARDPEIFTLKTVRAEYLDTEKAEQLTKVNGKVNIKKQNKSAKYRPVNLNFDGENEYSLRDVFVKWMYTIPHSEFEKSNAIDIVEYYVYNRALRDDKLSSDQKAEIKVNAREEGELFFDRFLHEVITPEDQDRLDEVWNGLYNAQSDINYKRVPVGFECSKTFKSGLLKISDAQREGVAFYEAMGSGICAYDVGVGKTMTAIIAVASAMANGRCLRPLIVVPKPTYKKWIAELVGYTDRETREFVPGVLSFTGIEVNDWSNLGTNIKKKINLNKKVPVNSITIVTYEGLTKIGFSANIEDDMFIELTNILGQSEEKTARDKEIDYQKYREKMGMGTKDTICDIDTVGFDFLCIDEAHRCKNVFAQVKSDDEDNKRYQMTSAVSERGIKAFFHANYIQRVYGRNVILLTATPFTNSPLEIYSILSLVAYQEMQDRGIINIQTFFDLFVLPTVEWTANYKDELVQKEVIKSFNNRLVLQSLIYNHILYKTGEEANVKRPCKVNLPLIYDSSKGSSVRLRPDKQVLTYIEPTPKQEINQAAIVSLAQSATKGQLNMGDLFRALAFSLDNALSPFLYKRSGEYPENYLEYVEESPKILFACECIRSVKEWHDSKAKSNEDLPDIITEMSGQVIYMNRGKRFFPFIKEYLEREVGFKKGIIHNKTRFDHVEIIDSSVSESKKEAVKQAFLEGGVKVIIGTATIREGIDLQTRGTVIYNLYPDWNPTDLRQLEGRIWRQGNQFGFVRSVMPLVQDTMDVFVFQKLEEKTERINDIWYKADRGNVLDVESLDPQEVKLALIRDINKLAVLQFDQEKQELKREISKIEAAIKQISDVKEQIKGYFDFRGKSIAFISEMYGKLKQYNSKETFDREKNQIEINSWMTDEQKKEQIKNLKDKLKKIDALSKEIEKFQTASHQEDSDVISLSRKCKSAVMNYNVGSTSLYRFWDDDYWAYVDIVEYFKEFMTKVRKTERTILKPRGKTIQDDLSEIESQYNQEKADLERKAEQYKDTSTDRFRDIVGEIEAKRKKLFVKGEPAAKRVEDFASLNHLLNYLSDDIDAHSCPLVSKEGVKFSEPIMKKKTKTGSGKEKRIRIAKAKAMARMRILQLLELN
jgi:hypothetical protein